MQLLEVKNINNSMFCKLYKTRYTELLSDIAKAFPNEAYTNFFFCYQQKFMHLMWIVPNIPNISKTSRTRDQI